MASGDAVVQILKVMPPGANAAALDTRASASTPPAEVQVHDFDAATQEYLDYLCKLEGYDGGGLTFTLPYSMSSATSNSAGLGIGIRRIQDDAEDIDTAHAYAYNYVTDPVPNVSGEVGYPTITFTDGADMDNWAEGELAIVRVQRDADGSDTTDDAAGDLELWDIFGLET